MTPFVFYPYGVQGYHREPAVVRICLDSAHNVRRLCGVLATPLPFSRCSCVYCKFSLPVQDILLVVPYRIM